MVSGVGAANVVLRDLHAKEYDTRAFGQQYVHFVDLPYKRPSYRAGDPISAGNAHLAAALCQGCQKPVCVRGCPAGGDIPGFLRRMEAQNYAGAARRLRERNPLAEVCGHVCAAEKLCQRRCYRRTFADEPVSIAVLERWVCQEAGEAGWLQAERDKPVADGPRIAVVGAGPSGLSCAYYCALTGCEVDLYDRAKRPGGALWQVVAEGVLPQAALERDLQGVLLDGIHFSGRQELGTTLDLADLQASHDAIYLALGSGEGVRSTLASALGPDWDRQLGAPSSLYAGGDLLRGRQTVVEAVADGRRAAVAMGPDLRARGKQ
jgi:NADPH-dependent glutamate synthase beta subunit-like oxidoreductase